MACSNIIVKNMLPAVRAGSMSELQFTPNVIYLRGKRYDRRLKKLGTTLRRNKLLF